MRCLVLAFMAVFLACQMVSVLAQSQASMTDEQAKAMLKQANHYLWDEGKPHEAIELLEKVVAYNPRFKASFPEEKLDLKAMAELGFAYLEAKQWENAISAFDLAEQYWQQSGEYESTMLPYGMSRCREKLALAGKPPADPLIVIGGWIYRGTRIISDDIVLVSASELAPKLGLKITSDGTDNLTFSIDAEKRNVDTDKHKTLRMTVGRKTAAGNGTIMRLPVPPQQDGKGIMIPLRSVGEYFGCQVKWEPLSKVIWL